MTRETARRVRQALITTGATLGLIVTAVAALTDHTTTLTIGAALLIGCGIAQAIEEHLGRPTRPQVPLEDGETQPADSDGFAQRVDTTDDWAPRTYRHHDHNHDEQ